MFVEHAPGDALHLMPGHAYFLVKSERELRDRPRKAPRRLPSRVAPRHAGAAPSQKPLLKARDHGAGITLDASAFAPAQRGGGWGPFAESFYG